MNGIHDMGGMDGFGAVDPVETGDVFHAEWEGKVMAASRVMGAIGAWNIDQGRYGIEMLRGMGVDVDGPWEWPEHGGSHARAPERVARR